MPDVIKEIVAREILTGTGQPTVEVNLCTRQGHRVTASAPSGTSAGHYEAHSLFDEGERYAGKGVRQAVDNVNHFIAPELKGKDLDNPAILDQVMLKLDGTVTKTRLGGNAILPVSVACAKAAALIQGQSLFRYLGVEQTNRLPTPIATVLAGGRHSPSDLLFEDYLYIMGGFSCFSEALEALVSIRFTLQRLLNKRFGPLPDIGGALAPPISDTRQAFDFMLEASEKAGFKDKVKLGLDVAASEFYLSGQDAYQFGNHIGSAEELMQIYQRLLREYPLVFLEDAFHEDDFVSHARLLKQLTDCRVVGDDLFASSPERIKTGIIQKAANGLLLKINQIGTVSEAVQAAKLARQGGMAITVSLRSNETNDDFIADLSVALGAEQIKLGSPVRGERISKYNRLLAIELDLGTEAKYAGWI